MLQHFVEKLSVEFDMDSETAKEESPGVYRFPVDDSLFITLSEEGSGAIRMHCLYPEVQLEHEGEFYAAALIANLYGRGTDCSILGLDTEGKRLTLSRVIEYTADYKEFKDFLEDFLNSADFWERELQAYGIKSA